MRHRNKKRKFLFMIPIVIGAIFLFAFIVMSLWNNILPEVIGVKAISFWQALGILALSKILFGGFGRGGGGGRFRERKEAWKQEMRQKWEGMNPEEREKFKAEWKNRCSMKRWQSPEHEAEKSGQGLP